MLKVKQVFDDSQQRFGAEKSRIILADNGIRVGKKRISAIMQECEGVYSIPQWGATSSDAELQDTPGFWGYVQVCFIGKQYLNIRHM